MITAEKRTLKKTQKNRKPNKIFTIGIISPITQNKFSKEAFTAMEGLCSLGFIVHILAEGDEAARNKSMELSEKFPEQFQIHESIKQNRDFIVKNSDILFVPEKPTKSLVNEILAENIIPVIPFESGFEDFNPQKESGEAFCFEMGNFWQMFQAVVRASENFKFPYDWKNLKKNLEKKVG